MIEQFNFLIILQETILKFYPYLLKLSFSLGLILVLNYSSHYRLSLLGIYPRKIWSIFGIFFSPFLHANLAHLLYNLIPLLTLSILILAFGPDFYWNLTWILIIFTGSLIWLFARPGIHIGASGLVTAYWGFLLTQALLGQFQTYHLFIAFICLYYFFGIFFGIFPSARQVSWEGHLFGLLSGILTFILGTTFTFCHDLIFHPPYLFTCPQFLYFTTT